MNISMPSIYVSDSRNEIYINQIRYMRPSYFPKVAQNRSTTFLFPRINILTSLSSNTTSRHFETEGTQAVTFADAGAAGSRLIIQFYDPYSAKGFPQINLKDNRACVLHAYVCNSVAITFQISTVERSNVWTIQWRPLTRYFFPSFYHYISPFLSSSRSVEYETGQKLDGEIM